MKTMISLPDSVFRQAEESAGRAKKSRSELYAEAIAQYLARHAPDAVTEAMNAVCDRLEEENNDFAAEAAHRILKKEPW